MDFKPNQSDLDRLFTTIAAQVEGVDADLREKFAGRPPEEIVAPATRAFEAIGIESLTDEWIVDYVRAVSAGEPFSINLG
ncbi:hypothetical protein ASD11_01120 [Aeromicrobium sp. Root495]|uniref:hypothetical protein n=1 Tax=Aeromicrobium sp. Root495 TaxID=1736550 RepID=UPI0006FE8299|nr:hypothetical protein [Aeromicrobium sp. Root495]KQY58297.1 hypothetical protein ASD11_01120 [Aeromicrobium sp. Root495]RYJ06755.1 MAG: hypothetical protein EON52_04740 [Actinomycetales bacterium]